MRRSLAVALALGCAHAPAVDSPGKQTITLIATNDVHGRLVAADGKGGLAMFAGYIANLRAARGRDGGAVVLVDVGDAFQGTLESNLDEGATVVRAYNLIGYQAMTVGNHEFDFGPVGPKVIPSSPGDDPRGALRQRASEARFPFLDANIIDEATGQPMALPGSVPSTLVDAAGVEVGIIGVTTIDTPVATTKANIKGLKFAALAPVIEAEAARLRAAGARVIVVAAHAGGGCKQLDNPDDLTSCEDGEIMKLARALPAGTVDAILAGHTHKGMAHRVNGIPVVEGYANGQVFSRIDLTVERGRVTAARMFPPQAVVAGDYEGAPVVADARVEAALAPALAASQAAREEKLGVKVIRPLPAGYDEESPLGDIIADLIHAARPAADLAVINSGALHGDWKAGELTYGMLFEAYPFDNRFATVKLRGADLAKVLTQNLGRRGGILLVSGVRAEAVCVNGKLTTSLSRADGRKIGADEPLTVVTSDFLVGGGDDFGLAHVNLPPGSITIEEGSLLREEMARILRAHGGEIAGDDPALGHRMSYPMKRPVVCPDRPPGPRGGEQ